MEFRISKYAVGQLIVGKSDAKASLPAPCSILSSSFDGSIFSNFYVMLKFYNKIIPS